MQDFAHSIHEKDFRIKSCWNRYRRVVRSQITISRQLFLFTCDSAHRPRQNSIFCSLNEWEKFFYRTFRFAPIVFALSKLVYSRLVPKVPYSSLLCLLCVRTNAAEREMRYFVQSRSANKQKHNFCWSLQRRSFQIAFLWSFIFLMECDAEHFGARFVVISRYSDKTNIFKSLCWSPRFRSKRN